MSIMDFCHQHAHDFHAIVKPRFADLIVHHSKKDVDHEINSALHEFLKKEEESKEDEDMEDVERIFQD